MLAHPKYKVTFTVESRYRYTDCIRILLRFYPDSTWILSRIHSDFIRILLRFDPDANQILLRFDLVLYGMDSDSVWNLLGFYPDSIRILCGFYPDSIGTEQILYRNRSDCKKVSAMRAQL